MDATLTSTLVLPAQATAAAFSTDGNSKLLAVGSDDGSVRLYEPPESKVRKAIRGLGTSVSSVVFHASDENDNHLWVAAGKSVYRFHLAYDKIILTVSDASIVKHIGQDEDDVVNQLALSSNRATLACTTDAGGVYVLDVTSASTEVVKMNASHDSIAYIASFIPDRPNELLTGGFDCTLILHDFRLRTSIARFDIAPAPALAPGISSLPPFITALALSVNGAVAAGTADGRIWVGLGGVKSRSAPGSGKRNKRSRKWGGLAEEEGFFVKIGESLVAGLQFISPDTLVSCTVHGKVALHQLTYNRSPPSSTSRRNANADADAPPGGLHTIWTAQSTCAKVDVLTCAMQSQFDSDEQQAVTTLAVAGLHADKNRGVVELWTVPRTRGSVDTTGNEDENTSTG